MNDYYQILEVPPNASQDQIKDQYRLLIQAWHPDKFSSPKSKAKAEEKSKQINEAYNELKDPIKREQYNRQRQYSQKVHDDQAQSEYDRKRREKEAREKAEANRRQKEQAEAKKREYEAKAQREAKERADRERAKWAAEEQAERTKAQREAEEKSKARSAPFQQSSMPDKKTATSAPPASSSLSFSWKGAAWVVFAILLVWLGARGLSPSSKTASIAIEVPTETLLAVTEAPTQAPDATVISDGVTMLLIPAGEFTMGSNNGDSDEEPIHRVYLSDYYIDKYEVTNATYKRCVDAGECIPPKQSDSNTRSAYYGNSEFDDYPAIYVDWNMANTYCSWHDTRLPSEAEWEKAARGANGRTYPWGENIDCDKANYQSSCVGDTTKVGSYLDGVSRYGIYDMAGNVWEWVNDWYGEKYYQSSPFSNPLGADSGQYRVLRGGSWLDGNNNARSAKRHKTVPEDIYFSLGFRCARSP